MPTAPNSLNSTANAKYRFREELRKSKLETIDLDFLFDVLHESINQISATGSGAYETHMESKLIGSSTFSGDPATTISAPILQVWLQVVMMNRQERQLSELIALLRQLNRKT